MDDHQHILHLLQQLQESTSRLAGYSEDPNMDVQALTRECHDLLCELQKIMPANFGKRLDEANDTGNASEQERQILELMKLLAVQTAQCVETLRYYRDKTESELAVLRQNQKVIRAYRGKR